MKNTKKYYPSAPRGHQAVEDQGCSMQHDVHVINHACSIQSMYVVVLQSCSLLPSCMELVSCSNLVSCYYLVAIKLVAASLPGLTLYPPLSWVSGYWRPGARSAADKPEAWTASQRRPPAACQQQSGQSPASQQPGRPRQAAHRFPWGRRQRRSLKMTYLDINCIVGLICMRLDMLFFNIFHLTFDQTSSQRNMLDIMRDA